MAKTETGPGPWNQNILWNHGETGKGATNSEPPNKGSGVMMPKDNNIDCIIDNMININKYKTGN